MRRTRLWPEQGCDRTPQQSQGKGAPGHNHSLSVRRDSSEVLTVSRRDREHDDGCSKRESATRRGEQAFPDYVCSPGAGNGCEKQLWRPSGAFFSNSAPGASFAHLLGEAAACMIEGRTFTLVAALFTMGVGIGSIGRVGI